MLALILFNAALAGFETSPDVVARYGPELSLQGGAEWPLAGRFGLGPFVLLGFGRYARESLDTSFASSSAEIGRKAVHVWVHDGVRGRIDSW